MGYLRTRSTPSLVAGLGLGVSYAYAGTYTSFYSLGLPVESLAKPTFITCGNDRYLVVTGVT